MLLLVGLGNPGPRYTNNRHNVGYMAVDAIRRRYGFARARARFEGQTAEGTVGGEKVLALKPETFMNESGRAVAAACSFYRIPPEDVIVVHDEIDLARGKVRAKRGGGLAGHNGLRSVAAHIGPEFRRVRLGVGHPGKERVLGHVLHDFTATDRAWVEPMLAAVAEAFPLVIAGDEPAFMSRVAMLAPPPKPPAERDDEASPNDTAPERDRG
jgi:PTH1 family peptidyl-tRNA hydrolase